MVVLDIEQSMVVKLSVCRMQSPPGQWVHELGMHMLPYTHIRVHESVLPAAAA